MNCRSCGSPLPADAKVCPNCGTPSPTYFAGTGASPSDPTVAASPYSAPWGSSPGYDRGPGAPGSSPVPPHPSTQYGSNPYGMNSSAPYEVPPSSPYSVPQPIPPPPPPYGFPQTTPPSPPRNRRTGLFIIGAVLLVLVLIGAGVFVFLRLTPSTPTAGKPKRVQATTIPSPQVSPTIPPGATATAIQTLYNQTTSGTPTINDPLSQPDNYSWDQSSDNTSSCAFKGGAYHSTAQPDYFSPCLASGTNFINLLFQVQITIVSGHSGGLVIRSDENDSGYYFRISTDGTYIIQKIAISGDNTQQTVLPGGSGSTSAIQTGNNQPNLIAVLAQGNTFYFYVNKQLVDSTSDDAYTSGQIGVYSDSDAGAVEAVFSNAEVWKL